MKLFSVFQRSKTSKLTISVSAASIKGSRHEQNEDRIAVNGDIYRKSCSISRCDDILITLFDGMSGESMGALCAEAAASLTAELFRELSAAVGYEAVRTCFDRYTNSANSEICRMLSEHKVSRGGCTLAAVYISDGRAYPFSLGDSRIYLHDGDKLNRISVDHTIAARKLQYGMYTQEEADSSPDSHRLTLYLGLDSTGCGITAESYPPIKLAKGMKLLICSDGVYDVCPDSELTDMLRCCTADGITQTAAAKTNGDDISAAVISIS